MDKEFLAGLGVPDNISELILQKFSEDMSEKDQIIDELNLNAQAVQTENQEKMEAITEKLRQAKVDYMTDLEIVKAGGKNITAIKALINMEQAFINDDGLIDGIDIDSVKQSAPYLFDMEEHMTEGTGAFISNRNKKYASPENMDFETYKKWRAMI